MSTIRDKQKPRDESATVEILGACLNSLDQGISFMRLRDGVLIMDYCNESFFELTGFPSHFRELPLPVIDFVRHSVSSGELGPGDADAIVDEQMARTMSFEPHHQLRTRANGMILEIQGRPLPDSSGYLTTYKDITARSQAETYTDVLLQALEGAEAGIAIYNDKDELIFSNEAMRGSNSLAPGSMRPGIKFEERMKLLIESKAIVGIEGREDEWLQLRLEKHQNPSEPIEIERRDGSSLLVNDIAVSNGYRVSVGTDITELKRTQAAVIRAKEEAELANRTKTEFLANMSHELRTPLNSIIGFSELLIATDFGSLGEGRMNEYLGDINRSGRHLLRLISDILDISKVEVGELRLHEEALPLERITEESVRMISERARRAGASIKIDNTAPDVMLMGDETRVKQIMLNLLTNAIKFTDVDGTIRICWRICGDQTGRLCLSIKDDGAGMTPENIRVAMEPFGQVANSMTRNHEGTGLGLPLSRRLAELHDATLEIESTLGQGTTVDVAFPPGRVIRKDIGG